MISAAKGEFETAMAKHGQIREQAIICYTLGIYRIIVCVNKMDEKTVNYSQERFEKI